MATIELVLPTTGPQSCTNLIALRASAALTASYVTNDDTICQGWDWVAVRVVYTKGDETSFEFKIQGYDGTNWTDLGYKATQASSVSAVTTDVMQMTATTTCLVPPTSVRGLQKVRVAVKATAGTPTGTLALGVMLGREAAGARQL